MNWRARVFVLPKQEVLDPQGEAIRGALQHLDLAAVTGVRSGRLFDLQVSAADRAQAERVTRDACERLLANTVVESFSYEIEAVESAGVGA